MKLITETIDECEVLIEAIGDTGKKSHFIEGIFMQAAKKNRNGRVYPTNILEKEMIRYDRDFIQTKRALGELNHPPTPQVNPERSSHLITEMKKNGNDFYGRAKILSTPMGNIVKSLIEDGVKIGVSTRGLGSVKPTNEGIMEVQSDFHLACVDIVTDPSGPNCFVNGIMENTEYFFDILSGNWRLQEEIENTVKEIKETFKATKPRIDEDVALKIFNKFINSLK